MNRAPKEAGSFLKHFGPRSSLSFQTFDDDEQRKDRTFARFVHAPESSIELAKLNASGAGGFLCVNETDGTGRKIENIIRVRGVFADLDDGMPDAFPILPTIMVQSSPGKFQAYWLLQAGDQLSADQFAACMARLVLDYRADPNAKDIARVLRVPGFLHQKIPSAPFRVKIVSDDGPRYSTSELIAAFPSVEKIKPQASSPTSIASTTIGASEAVRRYADSVFTAEVGAVAGQPRGGRNTRLFQAAGRLGEMIGAGALDEGATRSALLAAAATCGLSAGEADTTVSSGLKYGKAKPRDLSEIGKRVGKAKASTAKPRRFEPTAASEGAAQEQAQSGAPLAARPSSRIPSGFRYAKDGSLEYQTGESEGAPVYSWLCSPLRVLASTRDQGEAAWGNLVEITTRTGIEHEWAMPNSMLAGDGAEYRQHLLDLGLRIAAGRGARAALHNFLSMSSPEAYARCVSRVGWHGDRFVLPTGVIGDTSGERVVLQGTTALRHNFHVAGSLNGWRSEVASLAVGNSRLVLAICAAFGAPLIEIAQAESGGVHFVGGSSIGKSTMAIAAGSAWGGGGANGYLKSWRATDNALEGTALAHCDCLLALDEIGQGDARSVGEALYMLSNGAGKSRASKDGASRTPAEWRTFVLSIGEISLGDKVREAGHGKRQMAGQAIRFVDVAADAGAGLGAFEKLHGSPDGAAFADRIKGACKANYGHAAREFLSKLTSEPDARATIRDLIASFVESACQSEDDGQVKRVAARFGLLAASGELATEFGITSWPEGEAIRASQRCFSEWFAARGGTGPSEIRDGLEAVRAFIDEHGVSRFQKFNIEEETVRDRAGFVERTADGPIYYILPTVWRGEVLAGHDAKRVAKALAEAGHLERDPDGRPDARKSVRGQPRKRYYVVKPSISGGDGQ
jgi:uncharacterized protein (DUF927 family)